MAHKVWLYHADCPSGGIFNDDEAEILLRKGWVDSPAKIVRKEIKDTVKEDVKSEVKEEGMFHMEHSKDGTQKDTIEIKEEKKGRGRPRKAV